ncbi:MAG: hypothetical protein Q8R29_02035 [bacterium]|nr:hypothetical protein [bacterium]
MDVPSLPSLPGISDKAKSFLTKREKIIGFVGAAALGFIALTGLYHALPYINNFLGMALTMVGRSMLLAGMIAFVMCVLFVVTRQEFWTRMWYMYTIFSRKLDMAMVKSNPVGVLNAFADEYLNQKKQEFIKCMQDVLAKRNLVKSKAVEVEKEAEEHRAMAQTLRDRYFKNGAWVEQTRDFNTSGIVQQTRQNQFQSHSTSFQNKTALAQRLRQREVRMNFLCEILAKFQQAFDFMIQTVRSFVEVLTIEYESEKATAEATQTVASLVSGTDDKQRLFKMAVDYTRDQIATFTAQTDTFMQACNQLIADQDLMSDVAEDKMHALLEGWGVAADQTIGNIQNTQQQIVSGEIFNVAAAAKNKTLGERPLGMPVEPVDTTFSEVPIEPTLQTRKYQEMQERRRQQSQQLPPTSNPTTT